jgi:hypothetical protein
MRNAPVKLAPNPIRIATAGKIIIEVTAKPAPSNNAVLLFFEAMIKTSNKMKINRIVIFAARCMPKNNLLTFKMLIGFVVIKFKKLRDMPQCYSVIYLIFSFGNL